MNKRIAICLLLVILFSLALLSACQPRSGLPGTPASPSKNAPEDYADVRELNISSLTLSEDKIKTYWFSTSMNQWSAQAAPLAEHVLEQGKNPGLGVRALHQQGLTGKGVNVAIIDQNLVTPADHPEFAGKIVQYRDFGTEQSPDAGSMHGPAVASLLVGETIGTAPGARLYYAAAPSWKADAAYYADALNWLVDVNAKLPAAEKIRVVSVSAAPSGEGSPFKNGSTWDTAYQRAVQAGMLVLDCTSDKGLTAPCYYDPDDPDSVTKCTPGWPGRPFEKSTRTARRIFVPTSLRSQAEEYQKGQLNYQFTGQGGLSWSIPYLSGVLALGWQIHPELTGEQMIDLVFQSAYEQDGLKFINPPAFIQAVKQTE